MKKNWSIIVAILCFSVLLIGFQTSRPQKVTKLGYINNFNIKKQTFDFDVVEWISSKNSKRIEELHLDPDKDMPDCFYIYNHDKSYVKYKVTKKTVYQLLNRDDLPKFENVNIKEFLKYLKADKYHGIPYTITVQNGIVLEVQEHYVP